MANNFCELKRLREDIEALKLEIEVFIRHEKERQKRHVHDIEKCKTKLNMMNSKVSQLERKYRDLMEI